MSDAKRRKKARRVRTALIVLCVILSIILTAIIGVYIYIDHMLGQLNYVTDHTTLSTEEAASIAQGEWETIHPDDTDHVEETVTVPDLIGKSPSAVENTLKKLGLYVRATGVATFTSSTSANG
ncbi:MAG: PASTA domain-containing protein, partial [Oscillospiraceae bacterium]|nr:PASTA domain-containing protein [Oscillospiraceae bacterium]